MNCGLHFVSIILQADKEIIYIIKNKPQSMQKKFLLHQLMEKEVKRLKEDFRYGLKIYEDGSANLVYSNGSKFSFSACFYAT
jgi:hypothetical protein